MPLIQLTPSSLREQAALVKKYNSEQEKIIARIKHLVLALEDSWKGEAQDAFKAKFISMESNYKNLSKVLDKYSELMTKTAGEIEAADQTVKNMIRNI